MLFPSAWSLPSPSIESASSLDDMMLSAASTSSQHQPNFWFPGSPLPSFFSSSSTAAGAAAVAAAAAEKLAYAQPPGPSHNNNHNNNKILFDANACSSSSEGSPPLSHDYLHSRSNQATAASSTLNLTPFNYMQQNHHHHHHHHPSVMAPSSNNFLSRDDWSQIPLAQATPPTTITNSNTSAWHPQHPSKGKPFPLVRSVLSPILLWMEALACSIPLIQRCICIASFFHSSIHSLHLNGYSMIGRMIYNICCRRITSAHFSPSLSLSLLMLARFFM